MWEHGRGNCGEGSAVEGDGVRRMLVLGGGWKTFWRKLKGAHQGLTTAGDDVRIWTIWTSQ